MANGSGSTVSGFHTPVNVAATNVSTGSQPETVYSIFGGTFYDAHLGATCCFEYGNMEKTETDNGNGHVHSTGYTSAPTSGIFFTGGAPGPWAITDMEECATTADYWDTPESQRQQHGDDFQIHN